ncbi:acyl-CoA dehydrogenase family protein [Streptomyces sp. M10(2022)]
MAEGALRYAAGHLGERHQFGRPLATFQAVQHQLADCYIDIDAMHVTLWHAVDALRGGTGAADAERAALVAKWWTSQGGLNTVHRIQHVHGGIGVDTDYPCTATSCGASRYRPPWAARGRPRPAR